MLGFKKDTFGLLLELLAAGVFMALLFFIIWVL